MKIIMRTYESVVNEYEMELDEVYLENLNNAMAQNYIGAPQITVEMLKKAITGNLSAEDEEVKIERVHKHHNEANDYHYTHDYLYTVLREWIEEDVWNCDGETIESEMNDREMRVEEN